MKHISTARRTQSQVLNQLLIGSAVAAGGFSSVAIDEAKQVYTWGDSQKGQLGHGDFIMLYALSILAPDVLENMILTVILC